MAWKKAKKNYHPRLTSSLSVNDILTQQYIDNMMNKLFGATRSTTATTGTFDPHLPPLSSPFTNPIKPMISTTQNYTYPLDCILKPGLPSKCGSMGRAIQMFHDKRITGIILRFNNSSSYDIIGVDNNGSDVTVDACHGCYTVDDIGTYLELRDSIKTRGDVHVDFDSVVLAKDKKDSILAAISQIDNYKMIFETWGFEEIFEKGVGIGMLFYGVPGTGKTLMAQAVACKMKKDLKIIGTADIETSEPGGAERNIKKIFADNKNGKSVLLFDECDSLLTTREEVGTIMAAQINTLLSEIERYNGIVIFTTNRLGKLDPALERRIAAKIEFPFPDPAQRLAIWKRMIPKKAPLDKNVDLKTLSSYPMAGGNIKNAVLNAARQAAFEKAKTIKMDYFTSACEKEIESINQFMAAYEQSSHTKNIGGSMKREWGKVAIAKEKMEKINRLHNK